MNLNYKDYWVEMFIVFALFLGIFLSASSNTFLNYIFIMMSGIASGRILFRWKGAVKYTFFLIIIGFTIGFLAGTMISGANKFILLFLFIIFNVIGYNIHKRLKNRKVIRN